MSGRLCVNAHLGSSARMGIAMAVLGIGALLGVFSRGIFSYHC